MRLSEKTLELNFCSQFGQLLKCNMFWFGLTQKEEAQLGYDACTNIGGKVFIFQFKASSRRLGGIRRFHAPHEQMMKLKRICKEKSSVFYAFPLIGTTDELYNQQNIPEVTWLLDVYDLPLNFPSPVRKSGFHCIDVSSDLKKVAIHSPTIEVNLINAVSLAKAHIEEPKSAGRHVENLFHYFEPTDNDLTYITQTFTSPALGALLLPMS